jgi:hypothetical protein
MHRLIATLLLAALAGASHAQSLRFYGHGVNDIDRVKIRIDPHVPVDVGLTDFTIDFWMKANAADNRTRVSCAANGESWTNGAVMIDRALWESSEHGFYGIALFGGSTGRISFGVFKANAWDAGLCGTRNVADGQWHHIAITRSVSSGQIRLYVDGTLDRQTSGPPGNVSYRNGQPSRVPSYINNNVENYLVFGAEKFDADVTRYPSYNGYLDEVRFSTTIRWSAAFTPPSAPHTVDAATAALYHFDENAGDTINDAVGQSPGVRRFGGGGTPGPAWTPDTPFAGAPPPPPPPQTWRVRPEPSGFMVRPVYARNADGTRGAQLQIGGVPVNIFAGSGTLPACDPADTAAEGSLVYMRVTAPAVCPYNHSLGSSVTGYVSPCDAQ